MAGNNGSDTFLNRPCIPFIGAGIYGLYAEKIVGSNIVEDSEYCDPHATLRPGQCTANSMFNLKEYIKKHDKAELKTFNSIIERITRCKDKNTYEIYKKLKSTGPLSELQETITSISYQIYKLVKLFSSTIAKQEAKFKLLYIDDSSRYSINQKTSAEVTKIFSKIDSVLEKTSFKPYADRFQQGNLRAAIEGLDKICREEKKLHYGTYLFIIDLFWHTLRFEDRRYPYTSELAFAIALANDRLPTGALDLAQCAQCYDERYAYDTKVKQTRTLIKDIIEYCSKGDHSSCVLHECIAKFLRRLRYNSKLSELNASIRDYVGRLAITTNYDPRLEECIAKEFDSCYILFPVTVKKASNKYQWCLQKLGQDGKPIEQHNQEKYWDFATFIEKIDFLIKDDSCLVLKLHGSPLSPIDESKYEHFVVASEKGYLDSISANDLNCSNTIDLLQKMYQTTEHCLAYIGHSVSDWNVRIAIYKQVSKFGNSNVLNPPPSNVTADPPPSNVTADPPPSKGNNDCDTGPQNKGFICVRDSNDYKHAILKSLLIEPIITEFPRLGSTMLGIVRHIETTSDEYKNEQRIKNNLNSSAEEMQHA